MKYSVCIGRALSIAALIFFTWTNYSYAQSYYNKRTATPGARDNAPSQAATDHAAQVANFCPEHWETQECLAAVSESTLVMAANYGANLDKRGKKAAIEDLKEHCAAATAASQGDFPAEAMRSAFVECANEIVDISDETGIEPDKSHYQILVGAVLCLDGDRRCGYVEDGLQRY